MRCFFDSKSLVRGRMKILNKLARQIVKQGIDNFDGNLSIDFAGLDQ